MNSKVKIVVVQFSPTWDNKVENYQRIASIQADIEADVIVLPELCTNGYSFLTKEEAYKQAEESAIVANFFQPFSNKKNSVIIAGFAEKEGEDVYNSAIVVLPFTNYEVYRKTHLFFKEQLCFSSGNTGFKVIEHPNKDCKIGIMICYDWRFPESARTLALQGADIIACPANLVTSVWEIGMKSRALENAVFVAVANRCGTEVRTLENNEEQKLTFTGKSVLYDTMGAHLCQATTGTDEILTFTIDTKVARNKTFNAYNDIFNDRNPSLYKLN